MNYKVHFTILSVLLMVTFLLSGCKSLVNELSNSSHLDATSQVSSLQTNGSSIHQNGIELPEEVFVSEDVSTDQGIDNTTSKNNDESSNNKGDSNGFSYTKNDNDSDGTPDYKDIDDDNDGINDVNDKDANGNNIPDDKDDSSYVKNDNDSDGTPDYKDSDDDDDNIFDVDDNDADGNDIIDEVEDDFKKKENITEVDNIIDNSKENASNEYGIEIPDNNDDGTIELPVDYW